MTNAQKIIIIIYCLYFMFVGFYLGGRVTENRQLKMAQSIGIVFIKEQPYKVLLMIGEKNDKDKS
jgi:hypothetical protein